MREEGAPDVFRLGEAVELLALDRKARPYMTRLRADGVANVRGQRIPHERLAGHPVGEPLRSEQGEVFYPVRPTLARWVERMPRFARSLDPREIGPLLLHADLRPGLRVLEAGLGSGGLALFLLRVLGPEGHLVSYDLREESLVQGARNVEAWYGGPHPAHTVRSGDVAEGFPERALDRILLDLPEPWRVVPHALEALLPGGIFAAYLPTVLQVHRLCEELTCARSFADVQTIETLQRRWRVGRRSVRPEPQMVAHTGFLTIARRVGAEPA